MAYFTSDLCCVFAHLELNSLMKKNYTISISEEHIQLLCAQYLEDLAAKLRGPKKRGPVPGVPRRRRRRRRTAMKQ